MCLWLISSIGIKSILHCISLGHWFSVGVGFAHRGCLAMRGDIFGCHSFRSGVLLVSNRSKPGMVLNVLELAGQLPAIRKYSAQNVNGEEIEKPYFRFLKNGF